MRKILSLLPFAATLLSISLTASAQNKAKPRPAPAADSGQNINENKATPPERIKVAKDFKVELLYSVPFAEQGSWVNLCVDGKGRIIASDQYGGL